MCRSVCSRQALVLTKSLENHTRESTSLINSWLKKIIIKVGRISPDWSPPTKSMPRRTFTLCNIRLCIKLFRSQLNHILNHLSVRKNPRESLLKEICGAPHLQPQVTNLDSAVTLEMFTTYSQAFFYCYYYFLFFFVLFFCFCPQISGWKGRGGMLSPAIVPSSCRTELDHSVGSPNTTSAFLLNSAKTWVLQSRVPILATTALVKREGYRVSLGGSPDTTGCAEGRSAQHPERIQLILLFILTQKGGKTSGRKRHLAKWMDWPINHLPFWPLLSWLPEFWDLYEWDFGGVHSTQGCTKS